MTNSEAIIVGAVQLLSNATIWFIKDKKKSDADHLALIIEQLSKQVERLDKQNQMLDGIIKAEKEEKAKVVTARDKCLERVHELEVTEQKKNNEITLLKLKANDNSESNNY